MNGWSVVEFPNVGGRKPGAAVPEDCPAVYVSRVNVKKRGNESPVVRFVLNQQLMKQLRWVIGDRVSLCRGPDGEIGIVRRDNGHVITTLGKSSTENAGEVKKGQVRFSIPDSAMLAVLAPDQAVVPIRNPIIDGTVLVVAPNV